MIRGLALLACAACNGGAARLFELPAAAPSLTGLIDAAPCVVSITDLGAATCLTANGTVSWRADVCHPVRQRPAVVSGSLVVACDNGEWTALDLKTGGLRWKLSGRRAPATALVSDGARVVLASADGIVEAVDESGAVLWTVVAPSTQLCASGQGFASATPQRLEALDATTGASRWKRPWGAVALAASDALLFAGRSIETVVALDWSNGNEVWNVNLGALVPDALGVDGDSVFVGLQNGEVVELAQADGTERGRTRLGAPLAAPVRAGVAALQGRDGCAVVLKTGTRVCADHQLRGSAVLRDGVLMLGPRDGRVLGFKLKQ